MCFRTLHDADAALALGGVLDWEVGYSTMDGLYYVDTLDGLCAARCVPPMRADGLDSPIGVNRSDKWGGDL